MPTDEDVRNWFPFSVLSLSLILSLSLALMPWSAATAQESPVLAFSDIPSEQWVEVVSGDPTMAGKPYVLRLHNDAGYVVLPHTHPEIENIVVINGSWSLALGARYDADALNPMEVGDYGKVPAKTPHFGRAKTELTIQIHGIGPFFTDYYEPVYHLTADGVFLEHRAGVLTEKITEELPGCFELDLGDDVEAGGLLGTIVEAVCSPTNHFTQYWVQPRYGDRFWATASELTAK